ncbi:MAG: TIGR02300 family protein [Methylobacteriaceae bacterium]|nr:TIGR02300 family protein [Methylobacteriaceae bacterium]
MARPELGIKRQCKHCDAKFYDLNRDPIVCPKCGHVYVISEPHVLEDEVDVGDLPMTLGGEETVSLDDVAAAESVADPMQDVNIDDIDVDVDESGDDDDTFLEDEEEGDEDVSGFIDGGSLKDDEDT